MVVLDNISNGYRDLILPMACEDEVLRRAIGVVAAHHLGQKRPDLQNVAETGRSAVISRLRRDALQAPPERVFNMYTWATLIVLLVGETVTGSGEYGYLLQMLLCLSRSRSNQPKDGASSVENFLVQQTHMYASTKPNIPCEVTISHPAQVRIPLQTTSRYLRRRNRRIQYHLTNPHQALPRPLSRLAHLHLPPTRLRPRRSHLNNPSSLPSSFPPQHIPRPPQPPPPGSPAAPRPANRPRRPGCARPGLGVLPRRRGTGSGRGATGLLHGTHERRPREDRVRQYTRGYQVSEGDMGAERSGVG